jgi:hypothetical protein
LKRLPEGANFWGIQFPRDRKHYFRRKSVCWETQKRCASKANENREEMQNLNPNYYLTDELPMIASEKRPVEGKKTGDLLG